MYIVIQESIQGIISEIKAAISFDYQDLFLVRLNLC